MNFHELTTGVGLFMHVPEFFNGVMGIDLGGSQAAMTQELFYRIQVGPMVHQVGGKTVAQNVRTFFVKCTYGRKRLVDQVVSILWV